jgi:hypothetical protein
MFKGSIMKVLNITVLTLLSLISFQSWSASSFTNVATISEKFVVAGVKKVESGMEMESYLLEVDANNFSTRKVKLPVDIESREVVGLFAALKDAVLVVTQITTGGGDKPQVHSYDLLKKSWKKIGEVDCVSFAKVEVTAGALEFSCEVTDAAGKVSTVVKKVSSPVNLKIQKVDLPVTKIESLELKATLSGEEFAWNQLKVVKGKNEKTYNP